MNKLILCEGATDAVLLSYYLEQAAGWKYSRKAPEGLNIKTENGVETVNWYRKGDDYLLISAVGGKDSFKKFYESRIKAPLFSTNAFNRIAVVTDRDQREVADIEKSTVNVLSGIQSEVRNNVWISGSYQDAYAMDKSIEILLVVIPKEHQGALETVMLDAISEDSYDKKIVDSAGEFAEKMRAEASKYIASNRLQLKAHLGVTWAVQYPEKVFSLIDEQIRDVHWEDSEILNDCFSKLIEI